MLSPFDKSIMGRLTMGVSGFKGAQRSVNDYQRKGVATRELFHCHLCEARAIFRDEMLRWLWRNGVAKKRDSRGVFFGHRLGQHSNDYWKTELERDCNRQIRPIPKSSTNFSNEP